MRGEADLKRGPRFTTSAGLELVARLVHARALGVLL